MSGFVEVGGRKFEYRRPTIAFIRTVAGKNYETAFNGVQLAFTDKRAFRQFKKSWKRFCADVLVRDWKWRLGLFPRELKLENILIGKVLEVARGFFDSVAETQNELAKQFADLNGSKAKSA